MRRFDESTLRGFDDELQKIAGLAEFIAKNKGSLGSAGALLGHGAAAGAVLGGLHGAYKNYEAAKDQGAGTGGAVAMGALGGLGGAMSGATAGGLIGGGAGYALGTLRPQAAEAIRKGLSTEGKWYGALGRFGQRQMHGLTGWKPTEGLSSDAIRGGSWATGRAAAEAAGKPGFDKALAAHDLQKKLEEQNLTNLPGLVGALKGPHRMDALKTLAKHQWQDPMTKLMVGGSALSALGTAMGPESQGGPGKGEAIGSSLGSMAGAAAGTGLPFVGSSLLASAGQKAGKYLGKGVDWLRGKPAVSHTEASELATSNGQHMPSERNVSPNAATIEGMR